MLNNIIRFVIISALVFSSCGTISHIKGYHPALQPITGGVISAKSDRTLKVEVQFSDDHKYDHGDSDQGDFNKLVGVQHKQFDPHYSTAMIGWRYYQDQFQLIPYFHNPMDMRELGYQMVGSFRGFINIDQLFVCEKDVKYTFYITTTSSEFIITGEGGYKVAVPHSEGNAKKFRTLTWFGGDKVAPWTKRMKLRFKWTNLNPFLN